MPDDFLGLFTEAVAVAASPRLADWGATGAADAITVERPALREHGDLSTNVAMVASGQAGRAPRELAAELVEDFQSDKVLSALFERLEIAGPGFINFYLKDIALAGAAASALENGENFGKGSPEKPLRILMEYVSANPTGPLHVGHARYAAYGDSLTRILEFAGHSVTTEFYINDYGTQMDMFGRSLAAAYARLLGSESETPEGGYRGLYIDELARQIESEVGGKLLAQVLPQPKEEALSFFRKKGCELMLEQIRETLELFRVSFDSWFSEASLYRFKALEPLIERLRASGDVVDRDGATWLATTRYGDDKDRVLIRSSGEPTYFASDIAYHQDKLSRGYDCLINIWGADHHGYVPRMKAAFEALSHDPEKLEIIIGQLVNVLERGEKRQMSKRAGTMITLSELIESIGVDAARFYLVDRSHDSTLDLDLEKARLQSEENPVYYVQYAHARIASILRRAEETGAEDGGQPRESAPLEPQERELMMKLLEFPGIIKTAAEGREPHRLTNYARELAADYHVFYHNCPVLQAKAGTRGIRLALCKLTSSVIRQVLSLLGVSAPERM